MDIAQARPISAWQAKCFDEFARDQTEFLGNIAAGTRSNPDKIKASHGQSFLAEITQKGKSDSACKSFLSFRMK